MVMLAEQDIKTKEVLQWKGVHLLHFSASSCSQKVRIFLNLKGIAWESHVIDLLREENYCPWFLGVNPRGLVPVLIHDGSVHIESNDILAYLEHAFPFPSLISRQCQSQIMAALKVEDDLHLDIRCITMRYLLPPCLARKKPSSLTRLFNDAGTIRGESDPRKKVELDFWMDYARDGITDQQIRQSALKLKGIYVVLEGRLSGQRFLMGDVITLLDVAWFIYTHRLSTCGYPFARLHPKIWHWYSGLLCREEFACEVEYPASIRLITFILHVFQRVRGSTFEATAKL